MNSQYEHLQAVFDALRIDFLDSLKSRCDFLESLILQINDKCRGSELFDDVYRSTHSLKGAGATHGIQLITAICHHFEDILSHESLNLDRRFVDHALSIVDLLRQIAEQGRSKDVNALAPIALRYEEIKSKYDAGLSSILLVETSKTTSQLIQRFLSSYQVRITVMQDSLHALQRLLHERFDLLIVGMELQNMTGPALIAALQTNQGVNAQTPAILLTSQTGQTKFPLSGVTELRRTPDLLHVLGSLIKTILEKNA